jgi:hypothetical protein
MYIKPEGKVYNCKFKQEKQYSTKEQKLHAFKKIIIWWCLTTKKPCPANWRNIVFKVPFSPGRRGFRG